MSLARRHRDRILAAQTVASAPDGGAGTVPAAAPLPAAGTAHAAPADRAAAQIALRLTHDLRRLKEIRSVDMKIAAKREMLPEYREWVAGILAADAGVGGGIAADVVPTCMVWLIDTGDYENALSLAEFILRHHVPMPSRYQRDAATIVVEEIADAALKAQSADHRFPLNILSDVMDLTFACDLHDEVRAKLLKAIGNEELAAGEEAEADAAVPILNAALSAFREAQRLHDRIGVRDRIKRANKLLSTLSAASDAIKEQGGSNGDPA